MADEGGSAPPTADASAPPAPLKPEYSSVSVRTAKCARGRLSLALAAYSPSPLPPSGPLTRARAPPPASPRQVALLRRHRHPPRLLVATSADGGARQRRERQRRCGHRRRREDGGARSVRGAHGQAVRAGRGQVRPLARRGTALSVVGDSRGTVLLQNLAHERQTPALSPAVAHPRLAQARKSEEASSKQASAGGRGVRV